MRWETDRKLKFVGIIWHEREAGKNLLRIWPTTIEIASPGHAGVATKSIRYSVPVGKPIRFRATITKAGVYLRFGVVKETVKIPADEIGRLKLFTSGADAVFSKVKVKAK